MKKTIFSLKTLKFIALSVFVFVVGIISSKFLNEFNSSSSIEGNQDLVGYDGGKYLRFVYIGSSSCLWCGTETNMMVKELKTYFNQLSNQLEYKFISTGIANDLKSTTGIKFLSESGEYDEIISGANYYNLGSYYYIWENFPYKPSTPQILITVNDYRVESAGTGSVSRISRDEKLLKRLDGYYEILEFFNAVDTVSYEVVEKQLFD